jgi:hypothetical protein
MSPPSRLCETALLSSSKISNLSRSLRRRRTRSTPVPRGRLREQRRRKPNHSEPSHRDPSRAHLRSRQRPCQIPGGRIRRNRSRGFPLVASPTRNAGQIRHLDRHSAHPMQDRAQDRTRDPPPRPVMARRHSPPNLRCRFHHGQRDPAAARDKNRTASLELVRGSAWVPDDRIRCPRRARFSPTCRHARSHREFNRRRSRPPLASGVRRANPRHLRPKARLHRSTPHGRLHPQPSHRTARRAAL